MDANMPTLTKHNHSSHDEEVSSNQWEMITMSKQEEDLIYRMHKLVGDRWDLIAGRIPGRKAEEIERFWLMRHWKGVSCSPKSITKPEIMRPNSSSDTRHT